LTKARAIIHLDLDAFYAAVEMLDNPSLRGKPVIVGGSRDRGVVSSASYEARKFGIHSAQPIAAALRLCPRGVFLPVRMQRYQEVSQQVFAIFRRYTPLVEPVSIDEAFLDVTGTTRLFGPPQDLARRIKEAVFAEIGVTVSAGVAPCKFVAKIASDLHKPDGLTVVPEDEISAFLEPLSIDKLWGVGRSTQKALALLGVRTIGDLRRLPLAVLERRFGKHGRHLHLLSRGIDERPVEPARIVKSIGREETFAEDLTDRAAISREILELAVRVGRRLRQQGFTGKTITLKVKYHDFVQITRSQTLRRATNDGTEIYQLARSLLAKTEAGRRPIRLLGIALSHLQSEKEQDPRQLALFETDAPSAETQLNKAIDRISDRFGDDAILPGTLLDK
jgi:DNA polymerase-4